MMETDDREWLQNVSDFWKSTESSDKQNEILDFLKVYTTRIFDGMATPEKRREARTDNKPVGCDEHLNINRTPVSLFELERLFQEKAVAQDVGWRRPNFFGMLPSSGHLLYTAGAYMSALAQLYAGSRLGNPGASDIEEIVLKWVTELVGYPEESGGCFVSGGAMGAVLSFVAARDARLGDSDLYSKAVVYTTEEVNFVNMKALNVVGLRKCQYRRISFNAEYRMNVSVLEEKILQDKKDGLLPFLIIASLGTTGFGIVDPIEDIAKIAKKYGVWYHVDASYGGFLLLSESVKTRITGVNLSDSVALNCHKSLSAPFGAAVVLVRDGSLLKASMARKSVPYLDWRSAPPGYCGMDYSFECTRPFRGFAVWFFLKSLGTDAIVSAIDEKMKLTEHVYKSLQTLPDVEVIKPDLTVVAFRYSSMDKTDQNSVTKKWFKLIVQDAKVILTPTARHELFYIRFCVLSFRSHIEHVEDGLLSIKRNLEVVLNARKETTSSTQSS